MNKSELITIVPSCPTTTDLESLYQQDEHGIKPSTQDVVRTTLTIAKSPLTPEATASSPCNTTSVDMTFSSSPVLYPASSSPPPLPTLKKRRLFQSFPTELEPKRARIVGGFLEDSEDEADSEDKDEARLLVQLQAPSTREPTLSTIPENVEETVGTKHSLEQTQTQILSSPRLPLPPQPLFRRHLPKTVDIHTASGASFSTRFRTKSEALTYEQIVAQRSASAPGRAKKSYYGIDIHKLMDEAKTQRQLYDFEKQRKAEEVAANPTMREAITPVNSSTKSTRYQMWTEKYRAKKFTELVGDERTHRAILRWLKSWDELVFPGSAKSKGVRILDDKEQNQQQHKKILLLTGPPGLGKTTLAHVCAKQAGYEVLEINASDDRSRDVVRGRIKDALGTETVRGIKEQGKARRTGRPVCVVVDEVDGVTTGSSSSGGEGGFIKALIDLVQLDQRNSLNGTDDPASSRKKKGDRFRMLRPLILVCNDVYAPSLRPLRTSSIAEIVHVRKAPIEKVIARVKAIFEKERIACDNDAVRRLCENAWGMAMRKQRGPGSRGSGEGDIRGVLVQAEWIAHKLRGHEAIPRLTRQWLEPQLKDAQVSQGHGRGSIREVVERIFLEGAGLPNLPATLSADDARLVADAKANPVGIADLRKRAAIQALREMIDTCGEHDRVVNDCFTMYPTQTYQDDVQLSKPNAGYDWLHFHDCLSSRIFSGQEWELTPYLSTSACGFHNLFAAVNRGTASWNEEKPEEEETDVHPFGGPRADFAAREAEKQTRALLTELQSNFSGSLLRLFSTIDTIATELIPNVGKILAPDVKPVIIGGSGGSASVASVRKDSEKLCIGRAVQTMIALDIKFEKIRVEIEGGGAHSNGGYAYRMEPPLDMLLSFHFDKATKATVPIRYAVRQVLDQELHKEKLLQNSRTRMARSGALDARKTGGDEDKENDRPPHQKKQAMTKDLGAKRDFFGRIINETRPKSAGKGVVTQAGKEMPSHEGRVWVSFHEGFSNAVRKPITLKELMDGF